MKKTTATTKTDTGLGSNYVLTLTIPMHAHQKSYQDVLARVAKRITIPGFRKGNAPISLVERQVSKSALLDEVMESLLPELYTQAIQEAGVEPLVPPRVEAVSVEPDKDWVVQAHTALAPTITLGDWKTLVKSAAKQHLEDRKKHDATHHENGTDHKHDDEQELLSALFGALIASVQPKVAPLLIENEARRQIEEFAKTLASARIELDSYLQSTGKTVESLQQDYMVSALANLQVEFVLQAISAELNPEVKEEEIHELLGGDLSKFSKESLARLQAEAKRILLRRKTVEALRKIATE